MQEQIKSIEFILENCDSIEIEGKYIGTLNVDDIKYSINRIACNYIDRMKSCHHFSISINREANVLHDPFGQEEWRTNKFDRLHGQDVTSIRLVYEDDKKEDFYVSWTGDSEYENACQNTYKNSFGDLFIVIDENKKVEDLFEIKDIDNEEYMKYIWSMYE